ncbi:oxysterol-binding protein, putative [Entamoeba invadens IP1]|uniref:Oxysterol-binding protein, putative n=1 Tax=Entamoeba invadens IP1 TaxID=370355 RepID=A0A0A1UDD0_ENTIV|nr:oxysterol-binding protein, putative [Entamoeba invadens IP1]ELP94443.1 oxysterol-binding protein, putative [Entamoeba invadens IP1]|eukprot:XP_004261214.1 oxysterol-binding protein, putative [Entamoeba invadens IP1]
MFPFTSSDLLKATEYVSQSPKPQDYIDAMEKDDGKSIIWEIVKQLRPGMSLDRVTLPTHILEPRSLLEKLTDYFTHIELVNEAANLPTPEERFVKLVQFFLSGFYVNPKTCKKPYNPLLGEFYRTSWEHSDGSKSFFIAEQTSHHPPISSIYACNRKSGWVGDGNLHFVTTFNGVTASAGIEGTIHAKFTKYNEDYTWNFPSAIVGGLYIPPLVMEIGGELNFECIQSKYKATVLFKTKPFFGDDGFREIDGTVYSPKGDKIMKIVGKYDKELFITDLRTGITKSFFNVDELKKKTEERKVRRYEKLHPFESEKLFKKVSDAIINNDQEKAMKEKFVLEEAQRAEKKLNDDNGTEHVTKLFKKDEFGVYRYKWENWNVYDETTEGEEIEVGGKLVTLKKGESLNEERIIEIVKDVPYVDWEIDQEPPHIMKSFRFLLEDDTNKNKSDGVSIL